MKAKAVIRFGEGVRCEWQGRDLYIYTAAESAAQKKA